TVIISSVSNNLDIKSLSIIEKSIETADKFQKISKNYSKDIERDFMEIDLSLIENVINKL
ncbi:MAG: GrdX family protein, partial [Bacillota bacterium]|nr:GrdX family protein [Bacillota bacterium]